MISMPNLLYGLSDLVDARTHPRNYQIFLLSLYASLVLGAMAASASADHVVVAGLQMPPLCPFKLITGLNCPGCGLTRAFVLAFHGQWAASFHMHLWGIPLAFLALLQIPYRIYLISGGRPLSFPAGTRTWVERLVLLSLILPWAVKLTARFL